MRLLIDHNQNELVYNILYPITAGADACHIWHKNRYRRFDHYLTPFDKMKEHWKVTLL